MTQPIASAPRSSPADLRANHHRDVAGALGMGITMALVSGLLPGAARKAGIDPVGLAVIAAAPFLANRLGVYAGRTGPWSTRGFALLRAGGALLLVLLVVLPVPGSIAGIVLGYWLTIAFGIPIQHRIWGAIYPVATRGRYLGFVIAGRTAAGGVAALVGGLLADRIGGFGAIAIAGCAGALCALVTAGIRAPLPAGAGSFSVRETWRAYRDVPALRRVGWAQGFYGGGLIAAGPLYALVQVDRLGLSLAQIGTIAVVGSIAATGSGLAWGRISDRRGGLAIIQVGTVLGALSLLCYAFAPSLVVLWLAAILVGLANAAMETGWPSLVADHTSLADRAKAVAGLNALTGARGLIAPFIGPVLVQAGVLSVTTAIVLCSVATAFGAFLYLGMRPSGEPRGWVVRADDTAHRAGRRARRLFGSHHEP
ncbi:MAG: MFS transporter [Chloroflexota bacterium]